MTVFLHRLVGGNRGGEENRGDLGLRLSTSSLSSAETYQLFSLRPTLFPLVWVQSAREERRSWSPDTVTVQEQACGQESELCGRSRSCDTSQHREGSTLVQGWEAVSWDWGLFEGNWPAPGSASCWAGHFLALERCWFASSVHIPSSPCPSLSFLWLGFSPVFVIRRLTVTDPKNVSLLHWITKIPLFYNRAG